MGAATVDTIIKWIFESLIAGVAMYLLRLWLTSRKNLPPGPLGPPIIGSLHLLGQFPHQSLAEMAHKYGPLMSLYIGQKLCIVAASPATAMEFLKNQDANFCSRPARRSFEVIFPKEITFSDITPLSRHLRKIFQLQLTTAKCIQASEYVRADAIDQMLQSIPKDGVVTVKSHLEVMTANVLTKLVLNKRFMGKSRMDQVEQTQLKEFIEITEEIGRCLSTFDPRDIIPAFQWLDVMGFERRFSNLRDRMASFLLDIISEHRQRRERSDELIPQERDLLDVLLDEMNESHGYEITEDTVISIIWEAFAAGMETTVLASEWALAEVVRNPEIQRKAHTELDAVVGNCRRVKDSHIANLKYIKAIVRESFRLHPTIPLLIPHQCLKACEAFGYKIPEKTQLLVNVWAIGRDPTIWNNPLKFNPDRFLDTGDHAGTDFQGRNFELLPFGAGRRSCLGLAMGSILVQSSIANLLHAFSWSTPEDLDMSEGVGLSTRMAVPLSALAKPRLSPR